MDPDQNLETLRELLSSDDDDNIVGEVFKALDAWISNGGFLPKDWVMTKPQETRGGIRRMSQAQRNRLWDMCGNYDVPFREYDYFIDSNGYVEGWIGGKEHATAERGGTKKSTIYTGVAPDGRSHT